MVGSGQEAVAFGALVSTINDGITDAGGTISYDYTVTNAGPCTRTRRAPVSPAWR
jgi:hypothetical protein